jgi:hypothetical protein
MYFSRDGKKRTFNMTHHPEDQYHSYGAGSRTLELIGLRSCIRRYCYWPQRGAFFARPALKPKSR